MLGLKDIDVIFHANTVNEREALDRLPFHVEDGDFIGMLETNGAGKSTLLNVISRAIPCDLGTILLDGKDIIAYPEYKRVREIGCLFQGPLKGTAPHVTIEKNLGLACSRGKQTTLDRAVKRGDRSFFIEKLKELGFELEDRISTTMGLSDGGQRQALALPMSIIVAPKLLLLDGHTATLDLKTAASVMDTTERIVEEDRIAMLMITYDIKWALEHGNRTTILNEGKIVEILGREERKNATVDDLLNVHNFV